MRHASTIKKFKIYRFVSIQHKTLSHLIWSLGMTVLQSCIRVEERCPCTHHVTVHFSHHTSHRMNLAFFLTQLLCQCYWCFDCLSSSMPLLCVFTSSLPEVGLQSGSVELQYMMTACLPAHLPACLPAYLPIYLPAHLPACCCLAACPTACVRASRLTGNVNNEAEGLTMSTTNHSGP